MRTSLFQFLFSGLVAVTSTDAHFRAKSFKYKDNYKSNGREILQNLTVNTIAKCAYECTANQNCDDANFDRESRICQLLRRRPDGVVLSLVKDPGLLYLGDADEILKQEDQVEMNSKELGVLMASGTSCKAIYDSGRSSGSKAYNLTFGSTTSWSITYCMMNHTGACGSGGWTLAMKIDGTKQVFNYDSSLWTNKETYNEPAGQTGTKSFTEAKLQTFWKTPFTKICLGMKSVSNDDINWLTIDKTADSLLSLFANGAETTTTLGQPSWKLLFRDHVLSNNKCNEGFNIESVKSGNKARLGILSQKYKYCRQPDSYIGVGTKSNNYSVSCGSVNSADRLAVPTNCFIFVQ